MVEAEGAPGSGSARIGLRAPRVAVRVEARANWQSMFALALSAVSGLWGGYGFIYLPRGAGRLHPALARILAAYDPDYLVDALWTHADAEAMEPGWHARHVKGWPADPEESATALATLADQVVRGGLGEDVGASLCSPYLDHNETRYVQVLSENSHGRGTHRVTEVLGENQPADFEVPERLDPLLTLALGLRAGYPGKPPLPLGRGSEDTAERLPNEYVRYALSISEDRPWPGRDSDGRTTAWDLTRAGLVQIGKFRPTAQPVAVIGSAPEDFALAVALDRMYGATTWVPLEWTRDPRLRWPLQESCYGLMNAGHSGGRPPIVTSISLSEEDLRAALDAMWPEPIRAVWGDDSDPQPGDRELPEIVAAEKLDLQEPKHLACAGDYDLTFTSPARADGLGGFQFVLPVPVFTPRSAELRAAQRPFWEVDVEVYPPRMPAGRDLRAHAMLAGDEPYPAAGLRSGRDGISFSPASMLFVPGGATLEQSIAKPRLRVPGLRGWIEALAAQRRPGTTVRLSQAGRRAMILTRLWGSRSAVARDLLGLNDFLREFRASGNSDADAYPEGDGVRLSPAEGYLTLDAAKRTLPAMKTDEIRDRLNHLLRINVLRRGLIVPCGECERRAFYRIDTVSEKNPCPRCGAVAEVTAAWRSEGGEPQWFYDLHGAVRELLHQNGDVPFFAGMTLAASARNYEEVPELDFRDPGNGEPDEIDIAAFRDGSVIIGEAKSVASLGTNKESNRTIQKLIRVSDLVGANEIVLATTEPGPWEQKDTDRLLKAVARNKWRSGMALGIRVITGLQDNPQSNLLG